MSRYPVCYVGLILPLSVVRWIEFTPGHHAVSVPSATTIVVQSIFALSGVVNVTLLFCTRPGILLLGETPERPPRAVVFNTSENVNVGESGSDLKLRPFTPMRGPGDGGTAG